MTVELIVVVGAGAGGFLAAERSRKLGSGSIVQHEKAAGSGGFDGEVILIGDGRRVIGRIGQAEVPATVAAAARHCPMQAIRLREGVR